MRQPVKIFLLSLTVGAIFACKEKASLPVTAVPVIHNDFKPDSSSHESFPGNISSVPPEFSATSSSPVNWITTHQLNILDHGGETVASLAMGEEGPGLWLYNRAKTAMLEMGVHANGFPFLLVTDYAIRNFGLGRVDGKNASAILVFRSDDIVKLVFGLDMGAAGQPPFLVYWSNDNVKHVLFGSYCDNPARACTN